MIHFIYLSFYKDENERWWVEYDAWKGDKEELEMVDEAKNMLDGLAKGENFIRIKMQTTPPMKDSYSLTLLEENGEAGATYQWDGFYKIWLCRVTKHVFGHYPSKIYFNIC